MRLTSLDLEEFRSYRTLHLGIDAAGLRLFGANGSGKTSVLEAIQMLATTRSPRTSTEREVIGWASGEAYAVAPYTRLSAQLVTNDGPLTIAMSLESGANRTGVVRKEIRLDGRSVRSIDAVGRLRAVLFSVEDVALISGPPLGRRRYLDLTISQLNGRYMRALAGMNRVLVQRNSLLKSFSRDRVHHADASVGAQLEFWDDELVRFASVVSAARAMAVTSLSELLRERFSVLAGGRCVKLTYLPSIHIGHRSPVEGWPALDEQAGNLAREYRDALLSSRKDDVRRGVTGLGPHRDDLAFTIDGVDLGAFGSRGEQRLGVVALKLAEVDLMCKDSGEPPVLLLDDVLSELDANHRNQLIAALADLDGQLIVTATDRSLLDHAVLNALPEAHVSAGTIVRSE